jgi:hypothetical protein
MITDANKRKNVLLNAGVPAAFLSAIDAIKKYDDLQFVIQTPEDGYFYLPQICNLHACLKGATITLICDNGPGSFYVLLTEENTNHFAKVFLELDSKIVFQNVDFLMADILIQLYELSDASTQDLTKIGHELGFKQAKNLFAALENANRSTVELDDAWRKNTLPLIIAAK